MDELLLTCTTLLRQAQNNEPIHVEKLQALLLFLQDLPDEQAAESSVFDMLFLTVDQILAEHQILPSGVLETAMLVLKKAIQQYTSAQFQQTNPFRFLSTLRRCIEIILPTNAQKKKRIKGMEKDRSLASTEAISFAAASILNDICQHHSTPATHASNPVRDILINTEQAPFLIYVFSALLESARNVNAARTLRVMYIRCFKSLLQFTHSFDRSRQILPGGSSIFLHIILGDEKQGSELIATAIGALEVLICVSMANTTNKATRNRTKEFILLEEEPTKEISNDMGGCNAHFPTEDSRMAKWDEDWLKITREKLSIVIARTISSVSTHPHWRVRMALVSFCGKIILNCGSTLQPSVVDCIDGLARATHDAVPDIAHASREYLQNTKSYYGIYEWQQTINLLESQFCDKLAFLGKRSLNDEASIRSEMQLMLGYVDLLKGSISRVFENSFDHIVVILCRLLEFSFDNDVLEYSHSEHFYPKKRFHHFRDKESISSLTSIIYSLGEYVDPVLATDRIVSMIRADKKKENDKSLLLLSSHMLQAVAKRGYGAVGMAKSFERAYMEILASLSVVKTFDDESNFIGAVVMEALGTVADISGERFNVSLPGVLYILLEKVDWKSNTILKQAADATLTRIALAIGESSVSEMLAVNVDYVLDTVIARLNRLDIFSETPAVLISLLDLLGGSTLPLLYDALWAVLVSIDANHRNSSEIVTQLLRSLDCAIRKLSSYILDEATAPKQTESRYYSPLKALMKDLGVEDETEGTYTEDEDASDKIQKAFKLVVSAVERSSYFTTAPDLQTRCLSLNIIRLGLSSLAGSKKMLLPLVHKVWPYLVRGAKDIAKPVAILSLRIISSLLASCGEFIGDRFVREVWPTIRGILQSSESKDKLLLGATTVECQGHGEEHLRGGSLHSQLTISSLECLVSCCDNTDTCCSVVWEIATTCRHYLERSQRDCGRSLTERLFTRLFELNAAEVYMLLNFEGSCVKPPIVSSAEDLEFLSFDHFPCAPDTLTDIIRAGVRYRSFVS